MTAANFEQLKVAHSFADLPHDFYTRTDPVPLTEPQLLHVNTELAKQLGLSESYLHSPEFLNIMAGNQSLPGGKSIAAVYSGHQFGVWAGQLGDGRAHLLGEIVTPQGPQEIQLKGSGLTPYSRMGDGRAVIRSTVREYLASEAMAGLGIPTTRALAMVTAQDPVRRETIERAAVIARVAPSFVRFGSFEHWATKPENQATLLRYVVKRFYPELRQADDPEINNLAPVVPAFFEAVVLRSARLVADWQTVGFCHGVLNTDNMSVLGLTLDYGPYGFMDNFQIDHICNHTDRLGRYAWNAQPTVVQWNLHRLAASLLALGIDQEPLQQALNRYEAAFLNRYHHNLSQKLGLQRAQEADAELFDDWWHLLHDQQADFTLAFRLLEGVLDDASHWLALFKHKAAAIKWLQAYRKRVASDPLSATERSKQMLAANPIYVLRNHLAQEAIEQAEQGSAKEINTLLHLLRTPFTEQEGYAYYAQAAPEWAQSLAISCSS